jgi:uncharacterized membrane protein
MKENVLKLISFNQLKNKDFIITTKSFEEIMRQIKEEMVKVQKSTENAPTKEEYEKLKNKLEIQISNLKEVKLEFSFFLFLVKILVQVLLTAMVLRELLFK